MPSEGRAYLAESHRKANLVAENDVWVYLLGNVFIHRDAIRLLLESVFV